MSLEVRVPREVTGYQPKIIFGLTWRQLGIVMITLPVVAIVFGGCFWLGYTDLGLILTTCLGVGIGALGWVRPMGLPVEKYFAYIRTWYRGRKVFVLETVEMEKHVKKKIDSKERARRCAWEKSR